MNYEQFKKRMKKINKKEFYDFINNVLKKKISQNYIYSACSNSDIFCHLSKDTKDFLDQAINMYHMWCISTLEQADETEIGTFCTPYMHTIRQVNPDHKIDFKLIHKFKKKNEKGKFVRDFECIIESKDSMFTK